MAQAAQKAAAEAMTTHMEAGDARADAVRNASDEGTRNVLRDADARATAALLAELDAAITAAAEAGRALGIATALERKAAAEVWKKWKAQEAEIVADRKEREAKRAADAEEREAKRAAAAEEREAKRIANAEARKVKLAEWEAAEARRVIFEMEAADRLTPSEHEAAKQRAWDILNGAEKPPLEKDVVEAAEAEDEELRGHISEEKLKALEEMNPDAWKPYRVALTAGTEPEELEGIVEVALGKINEDAWKAWREAKAAGASPEDVKALYEAAVTSQIGLRNATLRTAERLRMVRAGEVAKLPAPVYDLYLVDSELPTLKVMVQCVRDYGSRGVFDRQNLTEFIFKEVMLYFDYACCVIDDTRVQDAGEEIPNNKFTIVENERKAPTEELRQRVLDIKTLKEMMAEPYAVSKCVFMDKRGQISGTCWIVAALNVLYHSPCMRLSRRPAFMTGLYRKPGPVVAPIGKSDTEAPAVEWVPPTTAEIETAVQIEFFKEISLQGEYYSHSLLSIIARYISNGMHEGGNGYESMKVLLKCILNIDAVNTLYPGYSEPLSSDTEKRASGVPADTHSTHPASDLLTGYRSTRQSQSAEQKRGTVYYLLLTVSVSDSVAFSYRAIADQLNEHRRQQKYARLTPDHAILSGYVLNARAGHAVCCVSMPVHIPGLPPDKQKHRPIGFLINSEDTGSVPPDILPSRNPHVSRSAYPLPFDWGGICGCTSAEEVDAYINKLTVAYRKWSGVEHWVLRSLTIGYVDPAMCNAVSEGGGRRGGLTGRGKTIAATLLSLVGILAHALL